jgi:hypothetical protein
VQFLVRAFFALCFLGALRRFWQQLHAHVLAKEEIGPTIGIAAIMLRRRDPNESHWVVDDRSS